ncbi:MAG: molecular chaperone TorD family protein [Halioglobus sp.]|nr:molecular chaperone TorD family protein [Halioglobus sp.]
MTRTARAAQTTSGRSPAATRSLLYGCFAESFSYPLGELLEHIRAAVLADRLCDLLGELDQPLLETVDVPALCDAGKEEDSLAVEYTRLFDAGLSGPVCALAGGVHHGPQMQTMEEVLRFYNHFGLTIAPQMRELPDHITAELEFLHFLTYGESELACRGEDVAAYQRAQRDFIARHPGRWVPRMREKLQRATPMPFYRELARLLERFLLTELERLQVLHGRASLKPIGVIASVDV